MAELVRSVEGRFRFIHTADLHIDSPLLGLEKYDRAPVERIRGATRVAFENIVRLAIEERVDFVLIAGDLFDGNWRDMHTGLWMRNQLSDLTQQDIRVFLIHGNHDAVSKMRRQIDWPPGVHTFSSEKPETVDWPEMGVALHGQSFAAASCPEDIASMYPRALPDRFNIGLLHTSLAGNPQHDTYAPTSLETLRERGYDYWALGHVHTRSPEPLARRPWVAFPGNPQGRHIRETGPKGCLLVSVDGGDCEVEFRETDCMRWLRLDVELEPEDDVGDLEARARERLEACAPELDGRPGALRVVFRGACRAHDALSERERQDSVVASIRSREFHRDLDLWIEKVRFETSPLVDSAELRSRRDLLGELVRTLDELRSTEDLAALPELAEFFKKNAQCVDASSGTFDFAERQAGWLRDAERLLLARLDGADT